MSEDKEIKAFNEALSKMAEIIEIFPSTEEVIEEFLKNVDDETLRNLFVVSTWCDAMAKTITDFKITKIVEKAQNQGGNTVESLLKELDRRGFKAMAITFGMKKNESEEN